MSEVKVNKISPRTNCGTVTVGDSGDSVSVSSGVPVTINGDLKSNALKATDGGSIISQSGTTITIGASGDTVSLASGASQTGFGREGTVNWDTTAKTAGFTAVSGNGYFVNTTSGALTVTLPASPSAGDIVAVADYAGTAATNNITIARNSSNIEGGTDDAKIVTNREARTFVYVDGTQGWLPVNNNEDTTIQPRFVAATGGCITTCGNFKVHVFNSPGTFCVSCGGNPFGTNTVDYLVIAGGAGGAGGGYFKSSNGGGGAGGFRESSGAASGCYSRSPLGACVSALPVTAQGYPITVGAGGSGSTGPNTQGNNGSNSIFSTITSTGGGGGGTHGKVGLDGGSGGGVSVCFPTPSNPRAGSGNTPPVSPPQGNNGGFSTNSGGGGPAGQASGGGGGAGAVGGGTPASQTGGNGGAGQPTSITTQSSTYAGGGGGAGSQGAGSGGSGGGGNGASGCNSGSNADANKGSGGGGGASNTSSIPFTSDGGNGGSGKVVIRYKFQ
jgi:hypothetical protein